MQPTPFWGVRCYQKNFSDASQSFFDHYNLIGIDLIDDDLATMRFCIALPN
jgi:hypothetical protein